MTLYKHTQVGWLLLVIVTTVVLILAFWTAINPIPSAIITISALVILLSLFSSLTVVGDDKGVLFYFGPGIIRKRVSYEQIKSVSMVRNRWFYGWGVRWYGRGWLYNVSGLDGVELKLANGSQLRIGTDEPEKLQAFLKSKIPV
jgi:hypothetical protein